MKGFQNNKQSAKVIPYEVAKTLKKVKHLKVSEGSYFTYETSGGFRVWCKVGKAHQVMIPAARAKELVQRGLPDGITVIKNKIGATYRSFLCGGEDQVMSLLSA